MNVKSRTKMVLRSLAGLLLATATAQAGTIEVAPVSIELPSGTSTATLTVTNHNPARTAIQVRAFAWSQLATTDALDRTDDLIISPSIFQLEPNQSQTVRLLVRHNSGRGEGAYRLLVDELPGTQAGGTIQFAVRLSLPVFADTGMGIGAMLAWSVTSIGDGQAELKVTNRGDRHEKLTDLMLMVPGYGPVKPSGLPNPYVLANSERRWRIPLAAATSGKALRLSGRDLAGLVQLTVPVGDH